ncbi:MAG: hypothetical protein AAGH15_28410, partial [Myxococcota bacterium]
VDGGMAYHTRTLREGRFARYFDALFDLRTLDDVDLAPWPTLVIPCRTPGMRLAAHREQLAHYMDAGGRLVVLGETRPDLFLEGVRFARVPTNFWWWLEPEGQLDVRITDPTHPLFERVGEADLRWHVHGTLTLAFPARELVRWEDPETGGAIMVEAERGRGQLLLTTLDPTYHHGSGFMPATTRFLEGFVPWLAASQDEAGAR